MKILYINSSTPSYVADGLFHGLKMLAEIEIVDCPKMNYMYQDATCLDLERTGTHGNTLYGLLNGDPLRGERTLWPYDIDKFDYIIFTDIFMECDLFNYIYKILHPSRRNRICIVDGYDTSAMFPYFNNMKNLKIRPWTYLYPVRKVKYFKREVVNSADLLGISKEKYGVVNEFISRFIRLPGKLLPVSMSIPEELIEYIPLAEKSKDFVNYNLDPELADLFPQHKIAELGKWQPSISDQALYFAEIGKSRFGITTRRAGWDCLRHYEYAAKGAILCFRNLHSKPALTAPYGLDAGNCIAYDNRKQLMDQLSAFSDRELQIIQDNQYKWIRNHTTRSVATRFLAELAT